MNLLPLRHTCFKHISLFLCPRNEIWGHLVFVPSVCVQSACGKKLNLCNNSWSIRDGDFIFGMQTQRTLGSIMAFLLEITNLDFVAAGAFVFHKDILLILELLQTVCYCLRLAWLLVWLLIMTIGPFLLGFFSKPGIMSLAWVSEFNMS